MHKNTSGLVTKHTFQWYWRRVTHWVFNATPIYLQESYTCTKVRDIHLWFEGACKIWSL